MIGSRICAVALTVASAIICSAPAASAFDGYYGYYGNYGNYGNYGTSMVTMVTTETMDTGVLRRLMETGTCTPRPPGAIAKASSLAS